MRRAALLVAAALGCVLVGALAFATADHVSFWLALYWAFGTATTSGSSVDPSTSSARVVSVGVMLTAIPLLGSAFASLTAAHLHKHVKRQIGERADRAAREQVDQALADRENKGESNV